MLHVSTIHKSIVLVICMLVSLLGYSQEYVLEVSSFSLEENSLTAKNEPVRDTNNQKCALVIISGFGEENLRFNVGNTFSKVEEKKNDQGDRVYLLWIPEGTVKVTISSDSKSFTPVEYFFNPRVKKAETYMMDLRLSAAKSLASKQYLEFQIDPVNAYLEINDEPWEVNNGIAYKQVPRGNYQYRIQAKDYHTEVGTVDFSDLSAKKVVSIALKPNFGWLTITPQNGMSGFTIFIDNEMSSGELNRIKLPSGQHNLKVTCEKYLPYNQIIEISDGQDIKVAPVLTANFSTVNITAQDGASIYIDDKFVSNNAWSGPLSVGSYFVEIRKDNHKSKSETISIPKIGETYNFNYKELMPILGAVSIETNPPGAMIKIDGNEVGKTPVFIPELIMGKHSLSATLSGYKSHSGSFNVEEGKQVDLSYTLEKCADVVVTTPKTQPAQNNHQQKHTTPTPPIQNKRGGKKIYAIMDVDNIIQSMPDYTNLQQQIAQRQQQAESTLSQLQDKFDRAMEAYNIKSNSKNSDAVTAAFNEVNTFKETAQKDIEQFQKNEMDKLQNRVCEAANIVGRENGYEVIFPYGVALYCGSDVVDATELVKRKLKH